MNSRDYDHKRLARLLESSGITQEAMAAKCGVKRLAITRVVSGRNASWELIRHIVWHLNATLPVGATPIDARELLYPHVLEVEKATKHLPEPVS